MGGLGAFLHGLFIEVFAVTRAHVASIGANALLSCDMAECLLIETEGHGQGAYCLLALSGDAVEVSPVESAEDCATAV